MNLLIIVQQQLEILFKTLLLSGESYLAKKLFVYIETGDATIISDVLDELPNPLHWQALSEAIEKEIESSPAGYNKQLLQVLVHMLDYDLIKLNKIFFELTKPVKPLSNTGNKGIGASLVNAFFGGLNSYDPSTYKKENFIREFEEFLLPQITDKEIYYKIIRRKIDHLKKPNSHGWMRIDIQAWLRVFSEE